MADQNLIKYVKKNLAEGFSAEEIRSALIGAGWDNISVTDAFAEAQSTATPTGGFLEQHGKKVMVALAVLVALPALGLAGTYLYSELSDQPSQIVVDTTNTRAAEQETAAEETTQNLTRDLERLSDIQELQTALRVYFNAHQVYPKGLAELVDDKVLESIPLDPKLNQPYPYYAFGEQPNQYTLSFLLEGDVGGLRAGLQVFSADKILPADLIKTQQALVEGKAGQGASGDLIITDLSQNPFYPSEEVLLEVAAPAGTELVSSKVVAGGLSLLDPNPPFVFRFSAPATEGVHEVSVFGFDTAGRGHVAQTAITVIEAENSF